MHITSNRIIVNVTSFSEASVYNINRTAPIFRGIASIDLRQKYLTARVILLTVLTTGQSTVVDELPYPLPLRLAIYALLFWRRSLDNGHFGLLALYSQYNKNSMYYRGANFFISIINKTNYASIY